MKLPLLLPLLTVLSLGSTLAQTPKASLIKGDSTLRNPFSASLVTDEAYQKLLFRSVVAIGGLNIAQGKSAGTSLTVDDKGASLTLSKTPAVRNRQVYVQPAGKKTKEIPSIDAIPKLFFTPQLTLKAAAEDGFVTLFSGNEYQKTLGAGIGGLLFWPVRSLYLERTKKDLQWKYWQRRTQDSLAWRDLYTPQMRPGWQDSSRQAICRFITLRDELQKKDWATAYYDGKFLTNQQLSWVRNQADVIFMRKYLQAEHDVRLFLPPGWDTDSTYQSAEGESKWVNENLRDVVNCVQPGTTEAGRADRQQKDSAFFVHAWQHKVAPSLQRASLALTDSLQKTVAWEKLRYKWLSGSLLGNTVALPFFNPGGGTTNFINKQRDWYTTLQLAYNHLAVGQQSNFYYTLGLSGDYRRQLDPTTLQTYQRISGQHTGIDSVRVVEQQQLYPQDPGRQFALAALVGATYYLHTSLEGGVSVNVSQKFLYSHQSLITVGVFTPIRTGETTVVVMPLVRWDSQGSPHRWTVGISLSTSIPAFVRAKSGTIQSK